MRWFKRASSSESPRLLSLSPLRNGEIVGASMDMGNEFSKTTATAASSTNVTSGMTNSITNKNQTQQSIGNSLRKSRIGKSFIINIYFCIITIKYFKFKNFKIIRYASVTKLYDLLTYILSLNSIHESLTIATAFN